MKRLYELAHLSMISVPPARLAAVAAEAEFDFTGFRLTPSPSTGIDHKVLGDDRALESLRRAVQDEGISVLDVEVIRMSGPSAVEASRPLLEAAQALGARYVIATVEDDDESRRIDTLAQVAELAAEHGTFIAVEFMLFSAVKDLATCVQIVEQCGAPNVVVLADSLHLERSGGHPNDLRKYPWELFPYAQICGAPGAGPAANAHAARGEGVRGRLMPDEGDLPVREFIAALSPETILSVESPLVGQSDPGDPMALARKLLASARRVAGEMGSEAA
jgi:sugar phosphate isomerase/epimerase